MLDLDRIAVPHMHHRRAQREYLPEGLDGDVVFVETGEHPLRVIRSS